LGAIGPCRLLLTAESSFIEERGLSLTLTIFVVFFQLVSSVAKLDRLSRNLAFVATLMESGVEFVAVDNPHANKLTIHILAAVAEHEREAISERTKAALAAAKARGTRLGTLDPVGAVRRMGKALKAKTSQFAANLLPIIREIQNAGHTSCNAVAGQLNARKVATARGGRWTHVQVRQILDRALHLKA
jgi:DNA invertase Pin-like site-specific DNA recombinase